MDNYKRTIYYVQNPFIKELKYTSLPMSEFGKIHFFEVKRIFVALYVFSIIFIIMMLVKIFTNKRSDIGRELIRNFNSSVNIMASIFIFVSAAALIDFSKTFYYFHKIFFRNDYWVFDPEKDPIINALPEEFFMTELIFVIILMVIFTVVVKVLYMKSAKNTKKKL